MRIKIVAVSALLASCSSISMPDISMPEFSMPKFSMPKFSMPKLSMPTLATFKPYKIDIQQGNLVTPEMREKLKVGMSTAMVQSILGTPLISDPFHPKRWDYAYTMEKDGKMVDKQRLTLFFDDDRLARIDENSMPALVASEATAVSAVSAAPVPETGKK
ncbi:MAG: outer membrane protein assembly factor BamE [Nitrosomonadales bacterium]